MYGLDQTYTVSLSDGTEQDLIPNGSQISVKPSNRAEYAKLVRKARMMESEKQVRFVGFSHCYFKVHCFLPWK